MRRAPGCARRCIPPFFPRARVHTAEPTPIASWQGARAWSWLPPSHLTALGALLNARAAPDRLSQPPTCIRSALAGHRAERAPRICAAAPGRELRQRARPAPRARAACRLPSHPLHPHVPFGQTGCNLLFERPCRGCDSQSGLWCSCVHARVHAAGACRKMGARRRRDRLQECLAEAGRAAGGAAGARGVRSAHAPQPQPEREVPLPSATLRAPPRALLPARLP